MTVQENEIVRCEGNRCVIDTKDGLKVVEKVEEKVPSKESWWMSLLKVFAFLAAAVAVKSVTDEYLEDNPYEEENWP